MAEQAVKGMALLLGSGGGGVEGMFGWVSGMLGTQKKELGLKDDESFQENVEWIQRNFGPEVSITTDFPPIHEACALAIGDVSLLNDIDTAMKAAMVQSLKVVKQRQEEQGGFVAWSELKRIFEADGAAMFKPLTEEDVTRNDYEYDDTGGLFIKWKEEPSRSDIIKAENVMKRTVEDSTIWDMLQIDTERIKQIFGTEGIRATNFAGLIARSKSVAHIAIDVGVVRFPRMEDPFFKLYRFRVIVFHSETAVTFVHKKSNGIFCEFNQRKYGMTQAFTDKFTGETKKAVDDKFQDVMASFM